ncbi:MAG: hypothetical protein CBC29_03280 [Methylococcaceae bacterium TMED69]|nr:MAG: hypothetical protein CBC29_03280 [Methylococcaceae bacterium TMED69]
MSIYKTIIIIVFLSVIGALIFGFLNLIREGGKRNSSKTVKALTIRVVLSFTLVAIIGLFYLLGLIGPVAH